MRSLFLLATLLAVALSAVYPVQRSRGNFRAPRPAKGETWAVLVAGSNGWYNYRHQADVAHSYHVLRNHGIPEERIIVMMYDDVAKNQQNPFKGKLYNRPHGDDVYAGLKIDYKEHDVTPSNFMNVLAGNKTGVEGGNGRVVESSPDDRIFVYFTDHGAVGLISFPEDLLSVDYLNKGLLWMHKHNRFSQLVFYLEACESGSMFENILAQNINVYAITAANAHESSWGTYCDNDMNLPCLGDLFSVNWMTDSDKEDLDVETLEKQYELVKKTTDKSHVMHYGNLTIAQEPVGWFQGAKRMGSRKRVNYMDDFHSKKSSWPSRDVELFSLMRQKEQTNDIYEAKSIGQRIRKIYEMRKWVKRQIHSVVDSLLEDGIDKRRMFVERGPVQEMECHHAATEAFHKFCVNLNEFPYGMKYVYVLNNLCTEFEDGDTVVSGILEACINSNNEVDFSNDVPFY